MKVARKMVLMFTIGALILMGLGGYVTVRQEVTRFREDAQQHAEEMGAFMAQMDQEELSAAIETGRLANLVRGDTQRRLHIRWVWLDVPSGDPFSPQAPRHQIGTVRHGELVTIEVRGGPDHLLVYYPIRAADRLGGLEMAEPLTKLDARTKSAIVNTLGLMASMVLLSIVVVGLTGMKIIGQPLERLIDKTRRASLGDLSGPVHLNSRDELSELAEALNNMCERLDAQKQQIQSEAISRLEAMEQLRHAERLNTVGRLASGIAHEVGTPLNVVSGRAGLIASGKLPPEQVVASAETIKSESDRIASIIRQLLDFARHRAPKRSQADLVAVCEQAAGLLGSLAKKRHAEISVERSQGPMTACVDSGQMQQVLTNLIVNAIEAIPAADGRTTRGLVTLRVSRRFATPPEGLDQSPGEYFCIDVTDNGEGIRPEDQRQIFEPFFTTKEVGEGTGLGLSVSFGMVQEHGGWIAVDSSPGQGSRFSVYLPTTSEPDTTTDPSAA